MPPIVPKVRRDGVHGGDDVAVLAAARHVDAPRPSAPAQSARDVSDDERALPVQRSPEAVVADPELLVEEEEHLGHPELLDALVVPDLERPVDVLAVDLADAVRRAVQQEDPAHVRVDVPEETLGLAEAHLVDVPERRPHPVRGRRAPLPEVVHEPVALVVLGQLEERVALDVRDDRLDVVEEVPDPLGRLRGELLALLGRQRLVRDEERRGRLRPSRRAAGRSAAPRARRARRARRCCRPGGARRPFTAETRIATSAQEPGALLDVRERQRLVGRREERRLAFQDGPVAVRPGRRLGVEEDARVLSERRVLEVRPDLDCPEQVRAAHGDAGVRRPGGDEDDGPVVVQPAEELAGPPASGPSGPRERAARSRRAGAAPGRAREAGGPGRRRRRPPRAPRREAPTPSCAAFSSFPSAHAPLPSPGAQQDGFHPGDVILSVRRTRGSEVALPP